MKNGERIYTIGYQGKFLDQVNDIMSRHSIDLLIDTRRTPFSRNPDWSKKSLQAFFSKRYVSLTGLGNHGETATWEPKDQESARTALEIVADQLKSGKSVLLMCLERDHTDCHRSDVAEHLAKMTGLKVKHL